MLSDPRRIDLNLFFRFVGGEIRLIDPTEDKGGDIKSFKHFSLVKQRFFTRFEQLRVRRTPFTDFLFLLLLFATISYTRSYYFHEG